MGYISVADVKAWAPGPFTGLDDTVLGACIESACRDIEEYCGRLFTPTTGRVRYFDGDQASGADQHLLVMDPSDSPVRSISALTEDGASLTFASGYTANQVAVKNLGRVDAPCLLVRMSNHVKVAWSPGVQNITVTYDCGPADNASAHPVAVQAAKELAWLRFKAGRSTGVLSMTKPSTGIQVGKALSEDTLRALRALQVWRP